MDDQRGIQALLAAESEAQQIAANARKAKAARLRQAKEESDADVAAYRNMREMDFKKRLAEHGSGAQATQQRLAQETVVAVQKVERETQAHKAEVAGMLLQMVTTVNV